MELLLKTPAASADQIIVIRLWEAYLLYHPSGIYRTLTELSLDKGPMEDSLNPGRIIFRFFHADWDGTIKPLLYENRIPVIVHPGRKGGSSVIPKRAHVN